MEIKCKRCGNKWDYKGFSEFRISCSRCGTSISITTLLKKANTDLNRGLRK